MMMMMMMMEDKHLEFLRGNQAGWQIGQAL
jgi:hypothetical protein